MKRPRRDLGELALPVAAAVAVDEPSVEEMAVRYGVDDEEEEEDGDADDGSLVGEIGGEAFVPFALFGDADAGEFGAPLLWLVVLALALVLVLLCTAW